MDSSKWTLKMNYFLNKTNKLINCTDAFISYKKKTTSQKKEKKTISQNKQKPKKKSTHNITGR